MDQVLITREQRSKKISVKPIMLKVIGLFRDKKQYKAVGDELGLSIGQVASFIRRARECGLMWDVPIKTRIDIAKAGGLATKTKAAKKTSPERTTPFKAPLTPPVEKPKRVKPTLIDSHTAVTFEALEPHQCRWPFGDPKQPDFLFCGKRKELVGPYCTEHADMASQVPAYRRR